MVIFNLSGIVSVDHGGDIKRQLIRVAPFATGLEIVQGRRHDRQESDKRRSASMEACFLAFIYQHGG